MATEPMEAPRPYMNSRREWASEKGREQRGDFMVWFGGGYGVAWIFERLAFSS